MAAKRVLSVGQCLTDHSQIARTFRQAFGADVLPVDTAAEALHKLRLDRFDLVVVNRVFDLDGASGVDFIRQLKQGKDLAGVPVMLVSNYDEAQASAVVAGAAPGFGKAALGRPEMLARVSPFLRDAGGLSASSPS
jgi:DNA-binding response OmpR family regulator